MLIPRAGPRAEPSAKPSTDFNADSSADPGTPIQTPVLDPVLTPVLTPVLLTPLLTPVLTPVLKPGLTPVLGVAGILLHHEGEGHLLGICNPWIWGIPVCWQPQTASPLDRYPFHQHPKLDISLCFCTICDTQPLLLSGIQLIVG